MDRPRPIYLAFLSLAACGTMADFSSQRLADGNYQLECRVSLAQCLGRVDDVCHGSPFEVLSARDNRRAVDIPIGNYQPESRTSDAVIRCTKNKPLFGGGNDAPKNGPAPGAAQPIAAPIPARACVPGATQACIGSGACAGGQSCLADASGFGPCDCGPPRPLVDAGTD
jgi:hypothetical protein